jgi:hypothetical protein
MPLAAIAWPDYLLTPQKVCALQLERAKSSLIVGLYVAMEDGGTVEITCKAEMLSLGAQA